MEDLGSVTLLELNEAPDSKHLAYCLPTGEFICATAASAHCFANDASDAHGLYGRNLCQFLAPHDIERLEDYMRGHCNRHAFDAAAVQSSSGLQMMVRIERTGVPVWVRLQTVALTLRMSRCIDAVQSMCAAAHWFADASSFVVSDEDFGPALTAIAPARHPTELSADARRDNDDDDPFFFASPASSLESSSYSRVQPLDHQQTSAACSAATTPKAGRYSKRTSSTASTDVADDEEFPGVDDAESLAGYAFEADWASEVAHEPTRTSVDWTWLEDTHCSSSM